MKTVQHFWLYYLLMVVVQIVICNYFLVSPLVSLTILPALILCLPSEISTWLLMVIAFATGMSVDLLAEGVVGLNTVALVPAALLKKTVMILLFDRDSVERGNGFSFRRNGARTIITALIMEISIFMAIYVIVSESGTRDFLYSLGHFAASLISSLLAGMVCVHILTKENR